MNQLEQKIIKRADELYALRERSENVSESVAILEQGKANGSEYEVKWRLGRAYFFLGQVFCRGGTPWPPSVSTEPSSKKRFSILVLVGRPRSAAPTDVCNNRKASRDFFSKGILVCEEAVAENPFGVEAQFWLGVNLALCAETKWPFAAVQYCLRAKRAMHRAIRLDPSYHAAGPLRVLARLEHRLPKYLWGGTARSRAHYEQALSLAPDNSVTRVYFAELLMELGEKDLARSQLEQILAGPNDPAWNFEIQRDRRTAQDILKRL